MQNCGILVSALRIISKYVDFSMWITEFLYHKRIIYEHWAYQGDTELYAMMNSNTVRVSREDLAL